MIIDSIEAFLLISNIHNEYLKEIPPFIRVWYRFVTFWSQDRPLFDYKQHKT